MDEEEEFEEREGLARFLPILTWFPRYKKPWFRSDLIAALTITAFSVPNLMAFAQLAGLDPQYGLYAGIGGGIGYFCFGTIKRLNVGPSASQAILVASVLGAMAIGDPSKYLAMAMMAAVLTGIIFIIARALRLGFIINLIPMPVFLGFMVGMGFTIIMSQLPKVFGVPGSEGDFFDRLFHMLEHIDQTNIYTLGLGTLFLTLLFTLDRRFPRLPNTLIVVIISIVTMVLIDFEGKGVDVVGDIPRGLPTPTWPDVSFSEMGALLPLAVGLFILSFVETTTIGKALESKHGYKMDPDQELVALGVSNVAAGVLQGFPVSGSWSRSFLNTHVGAKSQMAGVMSALLLAVVALWFTGLFFHMPIYILGILIIVAISKLIDIQGLHRLYTMSKMAFYFALASFGAVLAFGVLEGLLIGVLISFIAVIYRISSPTMSILARIPETDDFKDVARHHEYILYPAVIIARFNAPFVFANAHTINHQVLDKVREDKYVEMVILDMETSPMLDVTAAEMLGDLDDALMRKGIVFRLANCTGEVRDLLQATYSMKRVGHIKAGTTVNHIINEWIEEGIEGQPEAAIPEEPVNNDNS